MMNFMEVIAPEVSLAFSIGVYILKNTMVEARREEWWGVAAVER